MGYIRLTYKLPEGWKVLKVRGYILSTLNRYARMVKNDFEATVATWNYKPEFEVDEDYAGGDASLEVWTDDDVYLWLTSGTRVRHAVMTPDFVPKTVPRWIGSREGSGGLAFVSRKINRPGIEARRWDFVIAAKYRNDFENDLWLAVMKGLQ